jgi:signal transduction histidine kinase
MAVSVSHSHEPAVHNVPARAPELPREPEVAIQLVAELERRIHALESQVQRCEAERDALAVACRDAREAQREAEESARAQEEILAVVVHDLRNPLGTIVMGAATLLHFETSADPTTQRIRTVAERIRRQSERMVQQMADLGDFMEIQAGRLALDRAAHAPGAIIATARDLLGPVARERGIVFEAHAAPDLPELECDADRVVRVLSNLVANAIKGMSRGGTIESGARRNDRERIVFFVRDNGPGLDRDEQSMLFRPFSPNQRPSYRRAWLGFAIARGIVDAHGGRIWVDSEPGAGTTVTFSLTPGN